MVILYFLVTFVIFFFMYKKYWPLINRKMKIHGYYNWIDCSEFWIMIIIPLFWVISLPLYFLWLFLDYIYERYIVNKDKTGNAENR
jgi:hypothetical protein